MKTSVCNRSDQRAARAVRIETAFGAIACRVYPNDATQRALLCVHGFNRTGRDFAPLAESLRAHCTVVTLDLPGRGDSPWLADKNLYRPETYVEVAAQVITALGLARVDFLGSSLGGHVGMLLAARTGLVERLIVNDMAPRLDKATFAALARLTRWRHSFESRDEAEGFLRITQRGAGPMTDAEWASYTASCTRPVASGEVEFDYDPDICVPLEDEAIGDRDLWPAWRSIRCPTLIIRGAESDILTAEVAGQMVAAKPGAALIEVEGGHPPHLLSPARIGTVAQWLFDFT